MKELSLSQQTTRRSFQEALLSLAVMLLLVGVLLQFWIYHRLGAWAVDRRRMGELLGVAAAVALALCLLSLYRWRALRRDLAWRENVDAHLMLLKEAVETMQIGITITDVNGRILYVNPAEAELHGWNPDELVGAPASLLAPEDLRHNLSADQLAQIGRWRRESLNVRRDGSAFPVQLMSNVVLDRHGRPLGVVTSCEDISERRRVMAELEESQRRLRNLAQHLEVVREKERASIANEIHNDLGAALTVLKMDLAMIEMELPADGDLLQRVHGMEESIDELVDMVRGLARQLRPFLLDDVGLNAAIEWQLDEVRRRTGIACAAFLPPDEAPLTEEVRRSLFRVFQEAVTNTLRHARARHLTVRVEVDAETALLEVVDDGVGATRDRLTHPTAFGLLAIRERAQLMGGEAVITSRPERGTTVRMSVPLKGKHEDDPGPDR